MKKKLFLALLTTLLLLLAATSALASNAEPCTHPNIDNVVWQDFDAEQHSGICPDCGTEVYGNHTGGDDSCMPTCSVCNTQYYNANGNHGEFSDWNPYNHAQHIRYCTLCWDLEYADHTGGDDSCGPICTECGDQYYNANGKHTGGTATCSRYAMCEVCGHDYGELSPHGEFSDWERYDGTQHYRYCTECGQNKQYANHTGGTATCATLAVCEVCGHDYGDLSTTHGEFTNWISYDETQHYRYCTVCGQNKQYGNHTGGTATCWQRAKCEVCNRSYGDLSTTNHGEFSDWIAYYDTQHYRWCTMCGDTEYADHTGGTATCTEKAKCEKCGEAYGDYSTTNHGEFSDWIACDETRHYRWCKDCGLNWKYGTHTGGTATCNQYAVCEVCDETYGELSTTNHGEFSNWTYSNTIQHYRYCKDCGENEDYADHTGGTATCESGPICEDCKREYGSSLGGHDWGEWKSNGDGTHTRVCLNDAAHTETEGCYGGTVTCTEDGVCKDCGAAYIPARNHNWGDWWSNGDGTHTRECFNDSTHTETGTCYGGKANCDWGAVCDLCKAPYTEPTSTHTGPFSEWTPAGGTGTHSRYCKTCLDEEFGDCTGGTANCVSGPVCTICEGEYGNRDTTAHIGQMSEWVINGAAEHMRTCSACGYYEFEKHSPGTAATCVTGTICAVCNSEYGHMDYNNHTGLPTEWEHNSGRHWKYCQTCQGYVFGYHTGGEATCTEDGVCEVCDAAYIPATGHKWGKSVSNGDGTHTRVCRNDASHKETKDCYGGEATCTAKAVCKVCRDEYGAVLGHLPGAEADCTNDQLCTRDGCGAVLAEKLGHDYAAVVTKPTCTKQGYTTYTCSRCKDSYKADQTAALEHWYDLWYPNQDGTNSAECKRYGCSHERTAECTLYEVTVKDGDTETIRTVCPVCGDHERAIFGVVSGATIKAVHINNRLLRGEQIVRELDAPFDGVLYAFTAAYEFAGYVEPFNGKVSVSLPLDAEKYAEFKLVRVDVTPATETTERTEVWTEVDFTFENGRLTFETHVDGLFLLVPVE